MAAAHGKRTDGWASLGHFERYAHRYDAKISAEGRVQRVDILIKRGSRKAEMMRQLLRQG